MILSDGTTSYTFQSQEYRDDRENIVSEKITAGGEIRSRTTGDRFITTELIRVTGAELDNLMDLINNNSAEYFYTPDLTPPSWNSSQFPMSVAVRYGGITTRAMGSSSGELTYYVSITIKSNEVYNQ